MIIFEDSLLDFKTYLLNVEMKSKQTVQAYCSDIKNLHQFYPDLFLDELNVDQLNDFILDELAEKSNASVLRALSAIKHYYLFLEDKFNLENNPSLSMRSIKQIKRLPKVLPQDIIDSLLINNYEVKDNFHIAIIDLLYSCGLRVSELVDLQFNQVFLDEKILRITGKGNKERIVPMANITKENLQNYLDKDRNQWSKQKHSYIFVKPNGKRITRQYVYTMLRSKGKELNLKETISPHTLRHCFATSLLQGGADLRTVQELLGHADISTTQIYTHINKKRLHDAYDLYHPLNQKGDKK